MDIIKIEDLEIQPYELENFVEEDHMITFKASISNEVYERLSNIRLKSIMDKVYFRVNYAGQEIKMRFGMVKYSEHENHVKIDATLVAKSYDDLQEQPMMLHDVSVDNLKREVLAMKLYSKKLETLLIEKGILSLDEVEMLNDNLRIDILTENFKLYKVKDIDNENSAF